VNEEVHDVFHPTVTVILDGHLLCFAKDIEMSVARSKPLKRQLLLDLLFVRSEVIFVVKTVTLSIQQLVQ